MHADSDDNSESQNSESFLFLSLSSLACEHTFVPLWVKVSCFVSMKGWCVVEGPEVCYTPENGQAQSRIPDLSSSPSSRAPRCHRMSPWVTVSLATCCLLRFRGDAERLAEGGKGGGGGGGGWWYWVEQPHELQEQGKQLSAITHQVSVPDPPPPSFSLINTRPWLKQQHEPNEPPFAYTCCVKSEPTPECEFTLTWSC